nr:type ISP restriction/modification enzyme [Nocardia arizonensis]
MGSAVNGGSVASTERRQGELPSIFPTPHHNNVGILVLAPRDGADCAVLATDLLPELSFFTYTAQFFPRWTYVQAGSAEGELDCISADAGCRR